MKDRHVVELECQVRQMNRELRRLRGTVVGCVVGAGLLFLLLPYAEIVFGLGFLLGLILMFGLFVALSGGVVMKLFEFLQYKWLRRWFRRKDARLRAEQARMRHEGLSLKGFVG